MHCEHSVIGAPLELHPHLMSQAMRSSYPPLPQFSVPHCHSFFAQRTFDLSLDH